MNSSHMKCLYHPYRSVIPFLERFEAARTRGELHRLLVEYGVPFPRAHSFALPQMIPDYLYRLPTPRIPFAVATYNRVRKLQLEDLEIDKHFASSRRLRTSAVRFEQDRTMFGWNENTIRLVAGPMTFVFNVRRNPGRFVPGELPRKLTEKNIFSYGVRFDDSIFLNHKFSDGSLLDFFEGRSPFVDPAHSADWSLLENSREKA